MVQFLIVIRTLAEILRLQHVGAGTLPPPRVIDLYVIGALVAALGCWLGVIFLIVQRNRTVVLIIGCTIAALLAYKVAYPR
jgi:hypothetical protein